MPRQPATDPLNNSAPADSPLQPRHSGRDAGIVGQGLLPAVPPGDVDLRHGFTLDAVNRLATAAVTRDVFHQGLPFADKMEIAWSAIVEHLYSSDQPPRSGDLIRAAWNGLRAHVEDEWHTHGISRARVTDGDPSMTSFSRYWSPALHITRSFEDTIIDRLAVHQIWPKLTPGQKRVLLALAAHDDYDQAADSLNKPRASFITQISSARQVFYGWWHQGEQPSGKWGLDRRNTSRRKRDHFATKAVRRRTRRRATSRPTVTSNTDTPAR